MEKKVYLEDVTEQFEVNIKALKEWLEEEEDKVDEVEREFGYADHRYQYQVKQVEKIKFAISQIEVIKRDVISQQYRVA